MNKDNDFELHAYVDGELSPEQQAEILEATQQDSQLAHRMCEINNYKAQLKLAYANPPGMAARNVAQSHNIRTLAAGLAMLAIGLLTGWGLHAQLPGLELFSNDRMVMLDADGRGQAPATADSPETRIVFHVTDPDQAAAAELLDEVDVMLRAYEKEGRPLRVEVVSNGEGLNLLRQGLSANANRIERLSKRYDNLTFVACKNTIDRLKVSDGIEVKLLPEAQLIDSGVNHAVNRQKEGWSYIRA